MNSQLYDHLKTYCEDDCDEIIGDHDRGDNAKQINVPSDTIRDTKTNQFSRRRKDVTVFIEAMTVVSVGLAINHYFCYEDLVYLKLLMLMITLSLIAYIISWKQEFLERFKGTIILHDRQQQQQPLLKISNNKSKEKMYNCRLEVSRLVGLVGGPPLEMSTVNNDYNNKCLSHDPFVVDDQCTQLIIEFLEAHIQLILSIDEAYYWIKISSSLHLGLGPYSQCVERAERAATINCRIIQRGNEDKETETETEDHHESGNYNGTTSSSKSTPNNRTATKITSTIPQKFDTSSILAVSSARKNIAKVIINESQSIVNIVMAVNSCIQHQDCQRCDEKAKSRSNNNNDDDDNNNINIGDQISGEDCNNENWFRTNKDNIIEYIVSDGLLFMPDVIDLAWIKSSRKHLADLLSKSVDYLTTIECLEILSSADDALPVSFKLNESIWNMRNLKEYIHGSVLLDKNNNMSCLIGSVLSSTTNHGSNIDNEFMRSLLQYRQQLNALNAALWSGQHYILCSQPSLQDRDAINRTSWWNQVKELSAECLSLENEIENKFVRSNEDSQGSISIDHVANSKLESCQHIAKIDQMNDTLRFEHGEDEGEKATPKTGQHQEKNDRSKTKTIVFSGKGAKDKLITKRNQSIMNNSMLRNDQAGDVTAVAIATVSLPPRDRITEKLLLRELQTRIRTVALLRDEEHVVVDASQVNKISQHEPNDYKIVNEERIDQKNDEKHREFCVTTPISMFGNGKCNNLKQDVTTDMFLGASGSLLDELKKKLLT